MQNYPNTKFVQVIKCDFNIVALCMAHTHDYIEWQNASFPNTYMCPTRGSSFFLGRVTALGVLCCFALFVRLTLLASFFHLSFKNMYIDI